MLHLASDIRSERDSLHTGLGLGIANGSALQGPVLWRFVGL